MPNPRVALAKEGGDVRSKIVCLHSMFFVFVSFWVGVVAALQYMSFGM